MPSLDAWSIGIILLGALLVAASPWFGVLVWLGLLLAAAGIAMSVVPLLLADDRARAYMRGRTL